MSLAASARPSRGVDATTPRRRRDHPAASARPPRRFDVFGLRGEAEVDEPGILAAAARLEKLAAREDPATKLVYGGFSQGGAVAPTGVGIDRDY